MKSNISKNTIAIRAALESDEQFGAVIPPVHLTTTFAFKQFGVEQQYDYTRTANPTRDALAEAVTVLEGGHGATVTSSGMSAGQYLYDLEIEAVTGAVTRILEGKVTLIREITR